MNDRHLATCIPPLARHLRPGMRVLDVGSGPGSITREAGRLAAPGEVVGVDMEPAMVAHAHSVASAEGVANVRFTVGNAAELPFEDGAFDVVYSHAVLDWVTSPEAVVREKVRVTAPGGAVFLHASDLEHRILHPPCPAVTLVVQMLRDESEHGRHDRPWNPFLGRRLVELLHVAGVVDIQVEAAAVSVHQGTMKLTPQLALPCWPLDSLLLAAPIRSLTSRGLLTPDIRAAVDAELDAWCRHPVAHMVRFAVSAWGVKPGAAAR
ncbi:MAG: methyltransferase domain-containing protein [Pirellulales bacterium]